MKIKFYSDYLEKLITIEGELLSKTLNHEGVSQDRTPIDNGVFATRKYWAEHYDIVFQTTEGKKIHLQQVVKTWQDTGEEFANYYTSKSVWVLKGSYDFPVELAVVELGLVDYDAIEK